MPRSLSTAPPLVLLSTPHFLLAALAPHVGTHAPPSPLIPLTPLLSWSSWVTSRNAASTSACFGATHHRLLTVLECCLGPGTLTKKASLRSQSRREIGNAAAKFSHAWAPEQASGEQRTIARSTDVSGPGNTPEPLWFARMRCSPGISTKCLRSPEAPLSVAALPHPLTLAAIGVVGVDRAPIELNRLNQRRQRRQCNNEV